MSTTNEYVQRPRSEEAVVASFGTYQGAQEAVDRLSDQGFPVRQVSIVGHDLSTVEVVTGRKTKTRAALAGAGGGAWVGLLVGLLLGVFSPGMVWLTVLLTSVALGGLLGAVIGFVAHWSTRGRRDFSSVPTLAAARYDVMVERDTAAEATTQLAGAR